VGVLHPPESAYVKETEKWEGHKHGMMGTPPARPYVYRRYPLTLYRAADADGGPIISETLVADSDTQEAAILSRGFAETPLLAFERLRAQNLEIAKLAAERNFELRRMSPQAQAEVAAFEAQTDGHQPEKPRVPIRKRGRPVKVKQPDAE
jgi:hypothetical protein